jgi:hypothetical protein
MRFGFEFGRKCLFDKLLESGAILESPVGNRVCNGFGVSRSLQKHTVPHCLLRMKVIEQDRRRE